MEENVFQAREYLAWLTTKRGASASTVTTYRTALEAFLTTIGATPLADVTIAQIESWLERGRSGRARGSAAPATLRKELSTLRAFYAYLNARGVLHVDPTRLVTSPKVNNINPHPVENDVWEHLWGVLVSGSPVFSSPVLFPAAARREAIVALGLGYFMGLRRHEIVTLGPHHVSTLAGRLVGFKRKGGGDDILDYAECLGVVHDFLPHLLPDPDAFLDPFHRLVAERQGARFLIPWGDTIPATPYAKTRYGLPEGACDPQIVNKRLRAWLRYASLPTDAFSPHALRHSFVTNLLRAGVPVHLVSRMANHSSVEITMRYAKAGGSELRDWRKQQGRLAL